MNHRTLDPEDPRLEELRSELEGLMGRSEFLLELSMDERCALPKLDEDRKQFTYRALEVGKEHPELLPPHIDIERLQKGLEFRERAFELFEKSNRITARLDDSIIASGSEAYLAALTIFQALASKSDDSSTLRDEHQQLQRLFEPWENIVR